MKLKTFKPDSVVNEDKVKHLPLGEKDNSNMIKHDTAVP